jgi:hypothetical protein
MSSYKTTFYIIKNKRFDLPYAFKDSKDINVKEECSICLEKHDDTSVQLNACNHLYHEKCIRMSLEKSNLCPLCRKDVYNIDDVCKCNTCIIL